jgi:hypothetical protein
MNDAPRIWKNSVFRTSVGFAVVGYLVAIGLYFAPTTWHFSSAMVIAICPPSYLTIISMTDPSFGAVAVLLAPLNAGWYGIVGLVVGGAVKELRNRLARNPVLHLIA